MKKLILSNLKKLNELVLPKYMLFGITWLVAGALLPYFDKGFSFSLKAQVIPLLMMFLAFTFARGAGMCLNHVIDQEYDAENPRTQNRILPRGEAPSWTVSLLGALFLGIFFLISLGLNTMCFFMASFLALLILLYSFTKRFTSLCHFVLGTIHASAPLSGYLAITGNFSFSALFLGFVPFLSIAANDILYAFQDMEFDRNKKLRSMPVRLGKERSLWLVRGLHLLMFFILALFGFMMHFGFIYIISFFALLIIFVQNHVLLMKKEISFERAFHVCNTYLGVIFLSAILGELLWHVL